MRDRRFFALVLWAALLLVPLSARAQLFSDEPEGKESAVEGRVWLSGGANLLWQQNELHELIFGKFVQAYFLEGGWHLGGGVDLLGSAGYRQDNGHVLSQTNLTPLPNKERLHLAPATAELRWRLQWRRSQWLVPYLRGGPTAVYFYKEKGTTANAVSKQGVKWGVVGAGGLLWRLDQLDPNARRSLRADGIDALYLDTGFHYQWIDDFGGTGFDLSAVGVRLGLVLWVR